MSDVEKFIGKQIATEANRLFREDLSKGGQLVRDGVAAFSGLLSESATIDAVGGSAGILKVIETSEPFGSVSKVASTPLPDSMKEHYYRKAMRKLFPQDQRDRLLTETAKDVKEIRETVQ